jgi:Tfp pilus assembly protein PilX
MKLKTAYRRHHGIVLLLTLLVLVVLSVIGYTLTAQVSAQRHRCQYLIDYQSARYAGDAGIKYALISLMNIKASLIERAEVPDFSDLFAVTDEEYELLLDEWAEQKMQKEIENSLKE